MRLTTTIMIVLCVVCVLCCISCVREKFLGISPQFSINLAVPQADWPDPKTITPAHQAVLDQFGQPDFIRIWWDESGAVKTYLEVDRAISLKLYREKKWTWIYKEMKKEITFIGDNDFKTEPLTDKLEILCEYGDPENRKFSEDRESGQQVEIWQYYAKGKLFTFWDNTLVKEQTLPRLGTKIKT